MSLILHVLKKPADDLTVIARVNTHQTDAEPPTPNGYERMTRPEFIQWERGEKAAGWVPVMPASGPPPPSVEEQCISLDARVKALETPGPN